MTDKELLSLAEPVLLPAIRRIIAERDRYKLALESIRYDDDIITFEEALECVMVALGPGPTPVKHADLVQLF